MKSTFATYHVVILNKGKDTDRVCITRTFFDGTTLSIPTVVTTMSYELMTLMGRPNKDRHYYVPNDRFDVREGQDKSWWEQMVDELYSIEKVTYGTENIFIQEIDPYLS